MCETSSITRRQAIQAAGATGVAFLVAGRPLLTGTELAEAAAATCVLTPQKTEGPYFVDEKLNRSNLAEDQAGMPLVITMYVFNANGDCAPVPNAMVDMWHANAYGKYSDVAQNQTTGQTWLRGYQVTDAEGKVTFNTIWPGWYSGRAVHIHFKVRYGSVEFTSQMFFADAMNQEVFKTSPYDTRGNPDVSNGQDNILGGDAATLTLNPTAVSGGYAADFSVGLALASTSGTATPTATATATPTTAADTAVAAAINRAKVVRTRAGARYVRINLTPEETVTLTARLSRGGRRLARRKVALATGRQTVRVPIRSGVRAGAATLTLRLADAAGNSRVVTRSVHVPRKKAA